MIEWITGTVMGKFLSTFLISMVPIIELRGGLPYGLAMGLDFRLTLLAAILGNLFPVPFLILFIRSVFNFLRKRSKRLNGFIKKLEAKAEKKGDIIRKYGAIGMCLLVAIPLPGTGAWTGSLVAVVLRMRMKKAVPLIALGVVIAATLISLIYYGSYFMLFA